MTTLTERDPPATPEEAAIRAALDVVNNAANTARHDGNYETANALVRARVTLYRAALSAAPAVGGEAVEALLLFRRAKDWIAGDSYDGIDKRGRELLEEADAAAEAALYAAPAPVAAQGGASSPADEALWEQTIQERDHYHEVADELAGEIAAITGADIGEHSSMNCPWQAALDAAQDYRTAKQQGPVVDDAMARGVLEGWAVALGGRGMVNRYWSAEQIEAMRDALTAALAP